MLCFSSLHQGKKIWLILAAFKFMPCAGVKRAQDRGLMGVGHGKMRMNCMNRTDLSRVLCLSNTGQQDR